MNCIKGNLSLTRPPVIEPAVVELPLGQKVSLNVTVLRAERLVRVKAAYTTRRVPIHRVGTLLTGDLAPRPGDVVLARVDKVGQHPRVELANGRRANIFAGDEIVVCYGNRYAPDQFEAVVPDDLGQCDLVAAGGIAARMLSKHGKMRAPTVITPLGLLGDGFGKRLNLGDFSLEPTRHCAGCANRPFTVAVVGSGMNAGQMTTAANLIHGMTRGGMRVGAAKLTGTGASDDAWLMRDAGAELVLDFTDAGLASTYLASIEQIQESMNTLLGHLCASWVDTIVLEVADGLYQPETAMLLASGHFKDAVDSVIFAAGDAMAGIAGIEWLREHNLPVLALSGALTVSPLAVREAQRATGGLPVLDHQMLLDPAVATRLRQQSMSQISIAAVLAQLSAAQAD